LSPRGEVTPPVAGLLVGADADGTIDDSTDEDEEWVVEAGFPLKALPIANDGTVEVEVSRCDTPHDGVRRCGAWKGPLSPTPARRGAPDAHLGVGWRRAPRTVPAPCRARRRVRDPQERYHGVPRVSRSPLRDVGGLRVRQRPGVSRLPLCPAGGLAAAPAAV